MQNGGKRTGAGRKPGSRGVTQQKAIDVAAQVLQEINAVSHWKALLTCGDNKVISDVLKYLTNRVHGMPAQTIQGGDKPLTIQFTWGSTPEWLPKK